MTTPLGTARNYDELQPILRGRAASVGMSRVELDRVAGVPAGYAAKALADVPLRKLGPDTLGPILGALGVKLIVVEDEEAMARFTAMGDQRDERYAENAVKHAKSMVIKISASKLRRGRKKGGKNSRKYMSRRKASALGRKASLTYWRRVSERERLAAERYAASQQARDG